MNKGSAIIISATILALSIVGSSYWLTRSIDRMVGELSGVKSAVAKVQVAGGGAPAKAPQRRRGPDPDKVYSVNTKGSPVRGNPNASITVVEFSDFQCPFCSRVTPTLDQVAKEYPDDVKIIFKHLPLSIHSKAPKAHAASEAANAQGKFWEMHDLIFANQRDLSEERYIEYAGTIGLDVDRFEIDMASPEIKKRVDADSAEAARLGITGTPGFLINGRYFAGAKPFSEFKRRIEEELAKQG
jgi:protein-disulfide isomerase